MANIIELNYTSPKFDGFSISNGAMDVFICTFGLSGSVLAKTNLEKRFIVWVLEKNQALIGYGTILFCISDMPWDFNFFIENKKVVLCVLEGMRKKTGWEKLNYTPNEDILFSFIEKFENLVLKMNINDINTKAIEEWIKESEPDDPINMNFPMCEKHGIFLTALGCYLCVN